MENHRRLFFALCPNAAERAALAAWQAPLQELCGGKVMRPDILHCTLVFLGEVAEQHVQALCLAAREVDFHSFELDLTTAHFWGHNHIVYAAPDAVPPALNTLVFNLECALRKQRFRLERHPYQPHVTLLRHALWSDAPLPVLPRVRWQINDFALVQSLSDEQGAHYKLLSHFPVQRAE
ncbi:MAG: RNA 2',3'-cyclic phosphodiesterase [Sideroxyarcus sp.]|nr:RNA 2',3'-cyclic phosphodiesterase [Sideroxyarcus sp.]